MSDIVDGHVQDAIGAMFPHGEGRASRAQVGHHLAKIAQYAYQQGRNDAIMGLMTIQEVADHFDITSRRARALVANRHERFGVGMRFGSSWLIHRDELVNLEPDARYRTG